ncbi:MAG: hypothetical protein WC356_02750 [Candidatus Micrarchaeia archaeon]|jgi:hypothetical protein
MNVLELKKMNNEELNDLAVKLKVEVPKNVKRNELENLVETAAIRHEIELDAKVRAELKVKAEQTLKDAGVTTTKKDFSSPESKAIEASKKVYALFRNIANPGATEKINKGCLHTFTLYDGRVHILPIWLVDNLRKTIAGTEPQYETTPHPVSGEPVSRRTGVSRKYIFEVLNDAEVPKDAQFGVVLDKAILDKLGIVGNQILAEAELQV